MTQPAHSPASHTEQPVRVLMVSSLPPPPGGVESWTQTWCERGLPASFELEVLDTRAFERAQTAPPQLTPTELRRNLRILSRIYRTLASGHFSLMHLNCFPTLTGAPRNLAAALIARRAGVPYIVHLRGTFTLPPGTHPAARFYRWAYRSIFAGAARILALGRPSYHALLELGDFAHKTCPLMPNFVDFRTIPKRLPKAEPQRPLRAIFTGALVEAKGVHTIVEIANRLPNMHFQLVGGAPDDSRARLLRQIRQHRLEGRVQVAGPVTHREVPTMLAANDVFLFPSHNEGFPNSVAEAMAVGLPVVASSVGALPEMIDVPQGGWLSTSDDVADYAKVLGHLSDEPALRSRMGRHNRQKALREYEYTVVVRRLCDMYANVASARP